MRPFEASSVPPLRAHASPRPVEARRARGPCILQGGEPGAVRFATTTPGARRRIARGCAGGALARNLLSGSRGPAMSDAAFLVATVTFFALSIWYGQGLGRL